MATDQKVAGSNPAGRILQLPPMKRTGQLDLPLHTGKAPRWLFDRMVSLGKCISEVIIIDRGKDYFLERLSDPLWFQSFGCILGFDWHSSGLTTTVCGALKLAFKDLGDYGIYVCGGKGATSRKTPQEIEHISESICADPSDLIYASRITAKVDNNALQDGFTLYHHTFIFTNSSQWIVIQQGMSDDNFGWARRYHWNSQSLRCFIESPHKGISTDKYFLTLNLIDKYKDDLRTLMAELSRRKADNNMNDILSLKSEGQKLPSRHKVLIQDLNPRFLDKIFLKTYEKKPDNFENLLSLEGVGAKTLRALALIGDLIYGKQISFRDPARFSFAHGGKDGYPYKIKLEDYDNTIGILEKAVKKAKIDRTNRIKALQRLYQFYND